MGSAYKDFLNKYTKGDKGKLTGSEARDFLNTGGSQRQLDKFIGNMEKDDNYNVGGKAYNALAKADSGGGGGSGGSNNTTTVMEDDGTAYLDKYYGDLGQTTVDGQVVSMTPALFDQLAAESLEGIKGTNAVNYADAVGNNNILVQELISASNDYASELNLDGVKYASDRNLDIAQYTADSEERWRKYLGDVESDTAKAVQGLKNQGAIDLQGIVNTGLTDVANIQGGYASERVELQGEYDVQRANIQADFKKFKAARAKEGQIYGSLMAGFWS
jgi:hypothetical protein